MGSKEFMENLLLEVFSGVKDTEAYLSIKRALDDNYHRFSMWFGSSNSSMALYREVYVNFPV